MNKKFWWSVGTVWIVMVATDYLFHGVWLSPWYSQTAQFWRSPEEMQSFMPLFWVGQLVFSWAFVWIYSKGISGDNQWAQAFRYALAILLVAKVPNHMATWAMMPYPGDIVARWLVVSIVQAFAASFVMTWTYKPSMQGRQVA